MVCGRGFSSAEAAFGMQEAEATLYPDSGGIVPVPLLHQQGVGEDDLALLMNFKKRQAEDR